MRLKIRTTAIAVALGIFLTPQSIMAAGSTTSSRSSSLSRDFKAGKKAVEKGDYQLALTYLDKAAKKNPKNADVQNLLGFSYRKLGNTDKAFEHYHTALKLKPKHRGANEYLGELYLETGQLEKAAERLKVLDQACLFGCEEYDDLKEAIEKYKATHGS